jgi:hypothetical protein
MPDVGRDLGVDIQQLWMAGKEKLPAVASEYRAAAGLVASTEASTLCALTLPSALLGGRGDVLGPWTGLRDELLKILRDTADNLDAAADALLMAADAYARTDRGARDTFDRLRQDRLDEHREASR